MKLHSKFSNRQMNEGAAMPSPWTTLDVVKGTAIVAATATVVSGAAAPIAVRAGGAVEAGLEWAGEKIGSLARPSSKKEGE